MARVIYWFRTDLRLHDSPALNAALGMEPECLWPVWTWDPHYVHGTRVGPNRWKFLLDCQEDVSKRITEINPNSRLLVLRGPPQTLLPKLMKAWKVTHLVFEKDTDAYARERDQKVIELAEQQGVKVVAVSGRTLWDSDDIVDANGDKPTMSLKQLEDAAQQLGEPKKPYQTPSKFPDLGGITINLGDEDTSGGTKDTKGQDHESTAEELAGPNGDFGIPTLEELGIEEKAVTTPHRGGEMQALDHFNQLFKDHEYIVSFEKPKTAPTQVDPVSTTLLSPHFHLGSIGIRKVYWAIKDLEQKSKKHTKPPTSLIGQLLFREMYFAAFAKIGQSFMGTLGNEHCRYIPWRLRGGSDEPEDAEASEWLRRWSNGITGFPWIDAAMRQLRQEGWIHHLARHAVASFLTRGGCFIAWERGMEVFEELLLDHEPACNSGNWQWLACTAFYTQYFRIYSPVAFPKKWDSNGDYVRRYVPELKDMPAKYIYEPWKAPRNLRPTDYPEPMLDFDEQKKICLDAMKRAYKENKHGNEISSYASHTDGHEESSGGDHPAKKHKTHH